VNERIKLKVKSKKLKERGIGIRHWAMRSEKYKGKRP